MPEIKEEWRDIEGYEGLYQVSNLGRVRSLDRFDNVGRKTKGKLLKPCNHDHGYLIVSLCKNNKKKTNFIHRLVANAFLENKDLMPAVNHKNGIKTDNTINNLEWTTASDNMRHAYNKGLEKKYLGENNSHSKLTLEQVKSIKKLYVRGSKEYGTYALAKKFNVTHVTILNVINNKTYKNVK